MLTQGSTGGWAFRHFSLPPVKRLPRLKGLSDIREKIRLASAKLKRTFCLDFIEGIFHSFICHSYCCYPTKLCTSKNNKKEIIQ